MTTAPRIINTWDQNTLAGGDRIALLYNAETRGRGGRGWWWSVHRWVDGREKKTDTTAHFLDYGHKRFDSWGTRTTGRASVTAARLAAEAWVASTYGKRDFVRNRRGDYVEREVNEKFPIPKREKPHA